MRAARRRTARGAARSGPSRVAGPGAAPAGVAPRPRPPAQFAGVVTQRYGCGVFGELAGQAVRDVHDRDRRGGPEGEDVRRPLRPGLARVRADERDELRDVRQPARPAGDRGGVVVRRGPRRRLDADPADGVGPGRAPDLGRVRRGAAPALRSALARGAREAGRPARAARAAQQRPALELLGRQRVVLDVRPGERAVLHLTAGDRDRRIGRAAERHAQRADRDRLPARHEGPWTCSSP